MLYNSFSYLLREWACVLPGTLRPCLLETSAPGGFNHVEQVESLPPLSIGAVEATLQPFCSRLNDVCW